MSNRIVKFLPAADAPSKTEVVAAIRAYWKARRAYQRSEKRRDKLKASGMLSEKALGPYEDRVEADANAWGERMEELVEAIRDFHGIDNWVVGCAVQYRGKLYISPQNDDGNHNEMLTIVHMERARDVDEIIL